MSFTKTELRLRKEAEKIAELAKLNIWNAEKWERGIERQTLLRICIHNMVLSAVVGQYTLFDEVLAVVICRYYFKRTGKTQFILWRQKRFRIFVHFILDEMYLLKKIELAHAIKSLPKEVRETVRKLNALRNSLAHSFFPENRKEHRTARKVLYAGKDIRSSEGLGQFLDDCHEAWVYLAKRAYGNWADS